MPTPDPPIIDEVARILFAAHNPASVNRYGSCTASGYGITTGPDGTARVAHRQPNPDLLLDPDGPSRGERAEERARMVTLYAETLERAGRTVERRTVRFSGPILLVNP